MPILALIINIAHIISEPGADELSLGSAKDTHQPVTFSLRTAVGSHCLQSLTSLPPQSCLQVPSQHVPAAQGAISWALATSFFAGRPLCFLPQFPIRFIAPTSSWSELGLSKIWFSVNSEFFLFWPFFRRVSRWLVDMKDLSFELVS